MNGLSYLTLLPYVDFFFLIANKGIEGASFPVGGCIYDITCKKYSKESVIYRICLWSFDLFFYESKHLLNEDIFHAML